MSCIHNNRVALCNNWSSMDEDVFCQNMDLRSFNGCLDININPSFSFIFVPGEMDIFVITCVHSYHRITMICNCGIIMPHLKMTFRDNNSRLFFAIVIDFTGLPTTSLCNDNNSLPFNESTSGGSRKYFSSFFSNFMRISFKGILRP